MNDPNVGMIDMSKMIRRNFKGRALEKHIFENEGGSSTHILRSILEPHSQTTYADVERAAEYLKNYGPALVNGFDVRKDFYNSPNKLSFDGDPVGKHIGYHAMVLIGSRHDETGKEWFLIQNWWPGLQFVEMSASYLKKSDCTLYFVKTPQSHIPDKWPTQNHMFAENENVDKPEALDFEKNIS